MSPKEADTQPYDAFGAGTDTLTMLAGATRYNRWMARLVAPFLGARNLELGAGQGALTEFVAASRQVTLVEPSSTGRHALGSRFSDNPNIDGIHADFFDVVPRRPFDCVYSTNVLEHIADDVSVLEHAARVLRPGGNFVAIVPAGMWLYSPFDAAVGHHRRYTRGDRTRLRSAVRSRSIPLKELEFRPVNPVGALGWFVRMRLGERSAIAESDARCADRLVPLLELLDRFRIPFGQSMLIAFRRMV